MIYNKKFPELLEEFRADEEKLQHKSRISCYIRKQGTAQSKGHGKKTRESTSRSCLWPNGKFENQNEEC
jgi:hypothetical protein